jgi:broad specificity phosphatase PhoE
MSSPGRLASIYLVRHGETELNASGVLRGRLDPPLNSTGRQEAEAVARVLQRVQPALIVSSPLQRAVETATVISAGCGVPVETDPRLIDRDYGRFAGQAREEVERRFGSLEEAPGVESSSEVLARAGAALDDTVERLGEGTGVVVAHDVVNRLLLAALDWTRFDGPDAVPQHTGGYNVLHRWGTRWIVGSVDIPPSTSGS